MQWRQEWQEKIAVATIPESTSSAQHCGAMDHDNDKQGEDAMNQEDLRDMLRARPFQPFRLHLTDGSIFDIAHPDLMIPGRRAAVLGVGGQPEQGMPDRFVTITLFQIVRVETLEQSQTGGSST